MGCNVCIDIFQFFILLFRCIKNFRKQGIYVVVDKFDSIVKVCMNGFDGIVKVRLF